MKQQRACALPVAAALMAIAGIGLVGSSWWIDAKAVLAQHLLERAWTRTLEKQRPVKAWSWADTWPVASLFVPRLQKRLIVLEGATGEAMAFAPGHMIATPLPGQGGTSIIAAHRNTHFEFLKDIEPGDEIHVTLPTGKITVFETVGTRIAHASHSGIEPDRGNGALALVTCYPFGALASGSLRYIVTARPPIAERPRNPTPPQQPQ